MNSKSINNYLWGALLIAAVAWYGWFRLAEPLRHEPFSEKFHGNDFKHIYLGAWMLTNGENPYDSEALRGAAGMRGFPYVNPYVYLPFTGLALSPLALLGTHEAMRVWFVANHLFLLAALALIFLSLPLRLNLRNAAVAAGLVALSGPLHRTLLAGQLNCALLFFYALVYFLERRRWPIAAGAVAAFAFLFKLAPGILFAYFGWRALRAFVAIKRGEAGAIERRVLRNSVRSFLSMALCSALLLGGSLLCVGVERHKAFWPLLRQMGYGKSTWADLGQAYHCDLENQSFNSLYHHLFVEPSSVATPTAPWKALGAGWANALTRLSLAVCVALVVWRTFPRRRRSAGEALLGGEEEDEDPSMVYALFMLLALLTPSIFWDHYIVIALWPLLACYARLSSARRGAIVLWCVAAGAMLAPSQFYVSFPRHGLSLLIISLALWGTLTLFGLCLVSSDSEADIS